MPVLKFVGRVPVVVNCTAVPAVVGRPVPPMAVEPLVKVTVKAPVVEGVRLKALTGDATCGIETLAV